MGTVKPHIYNGHFGHFFRRQLFNWDRLNIGSERCVIQYHSLRNDLGHSHLSNFFPSDLNSFWHQYNSGIKALLQSHIPTQLVFTYTKPAFKSDTSIFATWKLFPSIFHSLPITYNPSILIITFSLKLSKYYIWKGDTSLDETAQRQKDACYRYVKNTATLLPINSFVFQSLMDICFGCSKHTF